ncbi:MAG: hypothetical protein PUC55_12025 [Lachnospiraceae bacterium]|nr:hypothetical protein [Lachnospiraceae bacterium]
MKENHKIARQLKNFYIGVAVVALLLVIFNVLYAGYDSGLAFTGVPMEQKIENMITEQVANHSFQLNTEGFDMIEQVRAGRAYDLGTMNIWFVLLLLFVAWGVYYMRYQSGKTKEFIQTMPVKGHKWIVQPFLVVGGIVIAAYVLDGIGLLLVQTRYNQIYQRIVEDKGLGSIAHSCIAGVNADLCRMLLVQLLIILTLYVWFALWLTASKQKVVGTLAACGFGYWIYWILNFFYYSDEPVSEVINFLYGAVNPEVLLYQTIKDFSQKTETGYSIGIYMTVQIAWILLGTLAIIWISRRRELSRGRWFYTTGIEIFASALAGMAGASVVFLGECDAHHPKMSTIVRSFVVAIVVAVSTFCLLHPQSRSKGKEKKQSSNQIIRKRIYREMSGLFRLEWKENLFFLAANCIWVVMQCKGYNSFWSIAENIDVLHSFSADQIDKVVKYVYDSWEMTAGDVISWYVSGVVGIQIIWLLGRKLIQGYKERTVSGREFVAALPVGRQTRYLYETIRDCVMLVLPVIITTFVIMNQFTGVLRGIAINMYWYSQSIWGLTVISCSYLLMLYGLIRWIEMLIPNGVLQMPVAASFLYVIRMVNSVLIRCGAVGRTINNLFTLHAPLSGSMNEKGEYIYDLMKPEISFYFDSAMKYIYSLDYDITAPAQFSAFYNVSNVSGYIGYVLLYIGIAAVFLYFAGKLAKKQEYSVDGLYFPFAKYVFAAAVSIATGIVLMQNAVAWWHRMMIGILVIGIFVALVYYLDPERKLIKRQKVGVVK